MNQKRLLFLFLSMLLTLPQVIAAENRCSQQIDANDLAFQEDSQSNRPSKCRPAGTPECRPPAGFVPITTVQELALINTALTGHYFLCNDIDLSDYGSLRLGSATTPFRGIFEGNNKTIENLRLYFPGSDSSSSTVGLFSKLSEEAVVQNLTLLNPYTVGFIAVGSLVGENYGVVRNVHVLTSATGPGSVGTIFGFSSVGGLVGRNWPGSLLENSTSMIFVRTQVPDPYTGGSGVGGMVGYNGGSIINSTSHSDAAGKGPVGGLAGSNFGLIDNCQASGRTQAYFFQPQATAGGLVGANGGTIRRSIALGSIVNGLNQVGGLAGTNGGLIEFSNSSGHVQSGTSAGGLVGENAVSGHISHCTSSALIGTSTAPVSFVGGLVGTNRGLIDNAESNGTVIGNASVGGGVGHNYGTISSVHTYGDVLGNQSVGGLVGQNVRGSIHFSSATGDVTGTSSWVGGLIGALLGGSSLTQLEDSFARGDVQSTGTSGIGGLVGYNDAVIRKCYSSGQVSSTSPAGGLVGSKSFRGATELSYWNLETSNQIQSMGGFGRTTAEMTSIPRPANTFQTWDFEEIWTQENGYYPELR